MLLLFTLIFTSCDKEDEKGAKVTDYQEYELTVASKKILGMIFSEGMPSKKIILRTGNHFPLFKASTTKRVMNIT